VIRVLLIAFAGALGTLARYGVSLWAGRALGPAFPYGTLLVNLVGCFLITFVAQYSLATTYVSETTRLTVMTGFLGGLTTYSSFDLETTNLLRQGYAWTAGLYVVVTLSACFLAGLLGLVLAKRAFE
jgi:CrcB protein